MTNRKLPGVSAADLQISRRKLIAGAAAATAVAGLQPTLLYAQEKLKMTPQAFVYTEVAISVPFENAPWEKINEAIRQQPGFLNKTWLHGHSTQTVGGFYAFDSIDNARKFVTEYFPTEPRSFGVAHNTRVFDAAVVKDASVDLGAVHFGGAADRKPGAFVYTELQFSKPFKEFNWQERNKDLKQVSGLQNKVWLSGLQTNTLGGFDAFETVEQALDFAINQFPETAANVGCAFYTRVFDAGVTARASREMNSPYYIA
ncbi:YdhR family protein [Roseibium sp.]|uniref:YdhR family protein n=1 Tax=Roseibium sp. TaxID=1936156 RepID=UPI003B516FC4